MMDNPLLKIYTTISQTQAEIGDDCRVFVGVSDLGIEITVYWITSVELRVSRTISLQDIEYGSSDALMMTVRNIKASYDEKMQELKDEPS